jgi:hypothetical protein
MAELIYKGKPLQKTYVADYIAFEKSLLRLRLWIATTPLIALQNTFAKISGD